MTWSGKAIVEGQPQTMGSKRAFTPKGWERPIITDTGGKKLKTFQESLREAMKECKPEAPLHGPMCVRIRIFMPRPKSHFGTGRNASVLKESAPLYCTTKPDFDKVFRAVLDCGTHIWWHDDAQVCSWHAGAKVYDTEPRVEIEAWEIV